MEQSPKSPYQTPAGLPFVYHHCSCLPILVNGEISSPQRCSAGTESTCETSGSSSSSNSDHIPLRLVLNSKRMPADIHFFAQPECVTIPRPQRLQPTLPLTKATPSCEYYSCSSQTSQREDTVASNEKILKLLHQMIHLLMESPETGKNNTRNKTQQPKNSHPKLLSKQPLKEVQKVNVEKCDPCSQLRILLDKHKQESEDSQSPRSDEDSCRQHQKLSSSLNDTTTEEENDCHCPNTPEKSLCPTNNKPQSCQYCNYFMTLLAIQQGLIMPLAIGPDRCPLCCNSKDPKHSFSNESALKNDELIFEETCYSEEHHIIEECTTDPQSNKIEQDELFAEQNMAADVKSEFQDKASDDIDNKPKEEIDFDKDVIESLQQQYAPYSEDPKIIDPPEMDQIQEKYEKLLNEIKRDSSLYQHDNNNPHENNLEEEKILLSPDQKFDFSIKTISPHTEVNKATDNRTTTLANGDHEWEEEYDELEKEKRAERYKNRSHKDFYGWTEADEKKITTQSQQLSSEAGKFKCFIDSLIMDLEAMDHARCVCNPVKKPCMPKPSLCSRESFPVTITEVQDLGATSLYVKWTIHDCCGIAGYEIYVDGYLTNRYYHGRHDAAVVTDVDVTIPHKVALVAQSMEAQDSTLEMICSGQANKCKSIAWKKCRTIIQSNRSWIPSVYLYDPVQPTIASGQPSNKCNI
uniref:Uncharacterized protein n=1 Tax=Musca domestica TaxID=7370 RepID=A0A1I8MLP1_MUSDO